MWRFSKATKIIKQNSNNIKIFCSHDIKEKLINTLSGFPDIKEIIILII